ncbi:MAG: hypothetical protein WCD69_04330 [Xanthobacteraceae bacterium]
MATPADYPSLVAQAEKEVQGVKDPELKRIAFQKVLEELLSGGRSTTERPQKGGPVKRRYAARRNAVALGQERIFARCTRMVSSKSRKLSLT